MAWQLRLDALDTASRHYIAADFLLSAPVTGLVSLSISFVRMSKFKQGPDSSSGGHGVLILILILS